MRRPRKMTNRKAKKMFKRTANRTAAPNNWRVLRGGIRM